jgi:hypothetical protein
MIYFVKGGAVMAEEILEVLDLCYRILKNVTPPEIAESEELTVIALRFHNIWRYYIKTEIIPFSDIGIDQVFFYRTLSTARRALELSGAVKEYAALFVAFFVDMFHFFI